MTDMHREILRLLVGRNRNPMRIAGGLSRFTPVEDVYAPLAELVAAGLVESVMDRGKPTYRLTRRARMAHRPSQP
jgi:hypothetical protein